MCASLLCVVPSPSTWSKVPFVHIPAFQESDVNENFCLLCSQCLIQERKEAAHSHGEGFHPREGILL